MRFGTIINSDCVNQPPPPDPRCSDPAFSLANPDVCPIQPQLVIKPSNVLVCLLGSIQFKAFYVKNGTETDVTAQTVFVASDPNVAVVGASSGNATGVGAGSATITGAYQDLTASADLSVLGEVNCCDEIHVAAQVLVDNSKSMSLAFNAQYQSRLTYAKAAASRFIGEINGTKDFVGLSSFNKIDDIVLSPPVADTSAVKALVSGISQSEQSTSFYDALKTSIDALNGVIADRRVLLIISDGEDQTPSYTDANNPLKLISDFKLQGGTVICLGTRTHDKGFAFLNALATGGFFINAYGSIAQQSLDYLSGLKGYLCLGNCAPSGDSFSATGVLDYSAFKNWDVTDGHVDLIGNGFFDFLPGNGLYVDLAGSTAPFKGTLTSKNSFPIVSGNQYRLSLFLAGNQVLNASPNTVVIRVFAVTLSGQIDYLNQTITIDDFTQGFTPYQFTFIAQADVDVFIEFRQKDTPPGGETIGLLLDAVKFENVTDVVTLLDDNFDDENVQYVPPACGTGSLYVQGTFDPSNLVPEMTSNTTPSGIASASSEFEGAAWMAFDRNNGTSWFGGLTAPQWLQYHFSSPQLVTAYSITPSQFGGEPTKWNLQGSNDGSNWTNVDTRFSISWSGSKQTFTVASSGSFSYYRITIQEANVVGNDFEPGIAELELFSVGSYGYTFGYNCYSDGCLSTPLPSQLQDPSPLPDIEAGYTPPKVYNSSKEVCASCPVGFANVGDPFFTGANGGHTPASGCSGDFVIASQSFSPPKTAAIYAIEFTNPPGNRSWVFQGSNDGTTWTTIDTQFNVSFGFGTVKRFFAIETPQTFSHYRWYAAICTTIVGWSKVEIYEAAPASECSTSTATSTVSQSDADAKASAAAGAAAEALLNCIAQYSSTQQFTAHCSPGSFGQPITKSATAISYISQANADAKALAAAKVLAEDELDCTQSNNGQAITINDNAPATPYPSVKYVSGLTGTVTKVTVSIKKLSHTFPDDILMVLRSPSGETCMLMGHCGGPNGVSNVNLVFDDAAGSGLPDSEQIVSGTFKPTGFGPFINMPAPFPESQPYGTTLAEFIGIDPNGSWSLWIADDKAADAGSVALGFDLTITTA